jgi:hypothetical protein
MQKAKDATDATTKLLNLQHKLKEQKRKRQSVCMPTMMDGGGSQKVQYMACLECSAVHSVHAEYGGWGREPEGL